eukprot:g3206.t1
MFTPENLLIGGRGKDELKICDFGLSEWIQRKRMGKKASAAVRQVSDERRSSDASRRGSDDAAVVATRAKEEDKTSTGRSRGSTTYAPTTSSAVLLAERRLAGGRPAKVSDMVLKMDSNLDGLHGARGTKTYFAPEVWLCGATGESYGGFKADVFSCGRILFAMLTGGLAMSLEEIEYVYKQTLRMKEGRMDLTVYTTILCTMFLLPKDDPRMKHLSEPARDLLSKMLEFDPKQRISLSKVFTHPWLRAVGHTTKEGTLTYKPFSFFSRVRKVFVVIGHGYFRAYANASSRRGKCDVEVEIGELEIMATEESSFVLTDKTDGTQYRFVAKNKSERDLWLRAIAREAVTDANGMPLAEHKMRGMGSDQMENQLASYAEMHERGEIDFKGFLDGVGRALMLTFAPHVEGLAKGSVLKDDGICIIAMTTKQREEKVKNNTSFTYYSADTLLVKDSSSEDEEVEVAHLKGGVKNDTSVEGKERVRDDGVDEEEDFEEGEEDFEEGGEEEDDLDTWRGDVLQEAADLFVQYRQKKKELPYLKLKVQLKKKFGPKMFNEMKSRVKFALDDFHSSHQKVCKSIFDYQDAWDSCVRGSTGLYRAVTPHLRRRRTKPAPRRVLFVVEAEGALFLPHEGITPAAYVDINFPLMDALTYAIRRAIAPKASASVALLGTNEVDTADLTDRKPGDVPRWKSQKNRGFVNVLTKRSTHLDPAGLRNSSMQKLVNYTSGGTKYVSRRDATRSQLRAPKKFFSQCWRSKGSGVAILERHFLKKNMIPNVTGYCVNEADMDSKRKSSNQSRAHWSVKLMCAVKHAHVASSSSVALVYICAAERDPRFVRKFINKVVKKKFPGFIDSIGFVGVDNVSTSTVTTNHVARARAKDAAEKVTKQLQTRIVSKLIRSRPYPLENLVVRWDLDDENKRLKMRSLWQQHIHVTESRGGYEGFKHKYKLLKFDKLGKGGFGSVYRALRNDGEEVAVKLIDVEDSSGSLRSLTRELGIWCKLSKGGGDQHIVRMLEWFARDDKTMYIVMELAAGGSLSGRMKEQLRRSGKTSGPIFDELTARVWFTQFVKGLLYMHEKKYCHLDLKPDNLLIGRKGELKLCDFGLSEWIQRKRMGKKASEAAKRASADASTTVVAAASVRKKRGGHATTPARLPRTTTGHAPTTKPNIFAKKRLVDGRYAKVSDVVLKMDSNVEGICGGAKGTPRYIAPELFLCHVSRESYGGFKADVYSLGCNLLLMLAGELPISTKNFERARTLFSYAIRGAMDLTTLSDLLFPVFHLPKDDPRMKHLSEPARDLLSKMLTFDPKQRISLSKVFTHPWLRAVGSITKEGPLSQKTSGLIWTHRKVFVVVGHGYFRTYADASLREGGKYDVKLEIGELEWMASKGSDSFTLTDNRDGAQYRFVAESEKERDSWLRAIVEEAATDMNGKPLRGEGRFDGAGDDKMECELMKIATMYERGGVDFKRFLDMVGNALMRTFAPKAKGLAEGSVV